MNIGLVGPTKLVAAALIAAAGLVAAGAAEPAPIGADSFGQAMPRLNSALIAKFNYGLGLFRHERQAVSGTNGTTSGPGPLFNASACISCHIRDGRGHPPEAGAAGPATSLVVSFAGPDGPDPVYGAQLQDAAVAGFAPEGRVTLSYTEQPFRLGDGTTILLRTPHYGVEALRYGPLAAGTELLVRVAPPVIGLGLLAAIDDATILAHADPGDADGDGISGRVHPIEIDGVQTIGRFGWKAGIVTLEAQTERAALLDMGLSVPPSPIAAGDCTPAQTDCRALARQDRLEIEAGDVTLMAFYVAHLAVPPRRDVADPAVLHGEALFAKLGCAACHSPEVRTGSGAPAEFAARDITPYTDLLLHDMGPGLADPAGQGAAGAAEWRTPPLWGIGLTELVSGHTQFLHDGRARGLVEAIVWHDGEARMARDGFAALAAPDRTALLTFLNSL